MYGERGVLAVLLTMQMCSPSPTCARYRTMVRDAISERGYSALELVIVLSLVGILLAISIPSMRLALAREEVDGWVRALTYDIAAGRQAAITRRTTVTVTITAMTYTIGVLGGGTLRQATLPAGISMTTTCPANACAFDRRGVPIAVGEISVTSADTGRSYTLSIETGTGRVSYGEP